MSLKSILFSWLFTYIQPLPSPFLSTAFDCLLSFVNCEELRIDIAGRKICFPSRKMQKFQYFHFAFTGYNDDYYCLLFLPYFPTEKILTADILTIRSKNYYASRKSRVFKNCVLTYYDNVIINSVLKNQLTA